MFGKSLARAEITKSTQWLLVKERKYTLNSQQREISPWATCLGNKCMQQTFSTDKEIQVYKLKDSMRRGKRVLDNLEHFCEGGKRVLENLKGS